MSVVLASLVAAASLESAFLQPEQVRGANAWWHWQGANVTDYGITRDLEAMKSAGLSGATIFWIQEVGWDCPERLRTPINPKLEFRNEEWWRLLRFAVSESRRLGLELGIHNCAGYSCSGGDWIRPETAMKKVVWAEGDAQPEAKLGFYRDIAKVKAANGRTYRFGYTCTGKCCHPPPPGQETTCLEADKMSARAINLHLDRVLGDLKAHGIEPSNPGLAFILMDSYEAGEDGWTDDFAEEFRRRRGYDPIPFLPVIAGLGSVNGKDRDTVFRADWEKTQWELKTERHYEVFRRRVNEAGYSFHLEPYSGPFDMYEAAKCCDVAMNEFWEGLPFWAATRGTGGEDWVVGPVSRALGRRVVGAESFTGYPLDCKFALTPRDLKANLDRTFCHGINRLSLHHWCHQPLDARWKPGFSMGPWGTHFGENATWFEPGRSFYRYIQRVQSMLQRGTVRANALGVSWADTKQLIMDAAPASTFLEEVEAMPGGRVRVRSSGREYALLVVNPGWSTGPALTEHERRLRAKVEELAKAGVPVCRDGRVGEMLERIGEKPYFKVLEGDEKGEVGSIALQDGDTAYFFVANTSVGPKRMKVEFRQLEGRDDVPELWFPATVERRGWDGEWLELDGQETVFVVFRPRGTALAAPAPRRLGQPVRVEGWKVSFPEGGTAEGLFDWSKNADDDIRYFSGTATYRATVRATGRFVLDLGDVRDIAEVSVNGKSRGVAWYAPFRLEVELPGEENVVEVKVTNAWTNRLVGDEREEDDCRFAGRMEGFNVGQGENRRFIPIGRPVVEYPKCVLDDSERKVPRRTFSSWRYELSDRDLKPSGLIGPVTLSAVRD